MVIALSGHEVDKNKVWDDTENLQSAIDRVSLLGGGQVLLKGGIFFSGPLMLRSNVHVHIEKDTTLSFIFDIDRYPPVWTRWEGVECWAMHPLLFAQNSHHILLSGSGTIDGNGKPWWNILRQAKAEKRAMPLQPVEQKFAALNPGYQEQPSGGGGREIQFLRPPLVQLLHCSDVEIRDLTLQNSPFWNTHLVYSRNIRVFNAHFINPHEGPNTDGLNIDSCTDVTIEGCSFDVGDDCLGLKSGAGMDGLRVGRPTEHVTIQGCTMKGGHGGVVIGSETAGGVRNVHIKNCRMIGTDRGLRIKTRRGRGGVIEDISLSNCYMEGLICPVVLNCYYGPGGPAPDSPIFSLNPQPIEPTTPLMRRIEITGLEAVDCKAAAAFIVGLPEQPIEDVSLSDCFFSLSSDRSVASSEAAMYRGLPEPRGRGIRIRNVDGLTLSDITVKFPKESDELKETLLLESGVSKYQFLTK